MILMRLITLKEESPMRQSWQEIEEMYPDQWVLMKDMEFVSGNLQSATVIYAGKNREDIFRFENENLEKVQCITATFYTGEIIEGVEYSDEELFLY